MNVNLIYRSIKKNFFKNFVKFLRFETQIFEHTQFVNIIKTRVEKIRKNVLQDLKFNIKISIACDCWINLNHLTFLKIIVYFVNKNWQFREILIAFKLLKNVHFDERLIQTMLNIFKFHKLHTWLMILIADEVKNNDKMRKHLIRKLAAMNIEWNYKNDTIYCMIHVLQLIVNALLKELNVQIRNEDMTFRFNLKKINEIIDNSFLKNTIKKINELMNLIYIY